MSRCIDCTWLCELPHVMDDSPRESREDVNSVKKNPTTNTNNKQRVEVGANDGSSIKCCLQNPEEKSKCGLWNGTNDMKLQWLRLWQQLAPACKSSPLYQSL